jgi:hypothetical protein
MASLLLLLLLIIIIIISASALIIAEGPYCKIENNLMEKVRN